MTQLRLLALACALLLVPACATVSPSHTVAPDTSILRVGVCPNSPPMIFKQNGEIAGAEADLAQALGKALNRRIVFVEVEWEELIDALCDSKIDIIMSSMTITPARNYRIAFSKPYLEVGHLALTRVGEKYSYLMNLSTQVKNGVGVKKGTTADFLVQQEFPRVTRKYFEDGEAAAAALVKKKIDIYISDAPMIWYLAGLHEQDGLTIMPTVLSQDKLGWGMRRTDTDLIQSVNSFLASMGESGEFNRTLNKWMPEFR